MRLRGFTLLELIVVIAIIGVLSVVILPNFQSALSKANDTKLKQFAITLDKKNDIINKYDFEEGSGLVSKDSNIYVQNNLTLPGSGVTFSSSTYSSSSAYSLLFGGTSVVTSQNNLPALDGKSFSVSVWARRTGGFGAADRAIFLKGPGGTTCSQPSLVFRSDQLMFGCWWIDYYTGAYITDTNWHHIAISFDNATTIGVVYLDGKKLGQVNFGSAINNTDNSPLRIGGGIGPGFFGNIDDLRFFDKVILSGDVARLYAEGVKSGKFANR